MRRYLLAAATAAVTLTGLTWAGGAAAGAAAPGTRAAPGTQLWVARFAASSDTPTSAMAVSPHGSTVFVTGGSYGGRSTGLDYRTVAYNAASGRRVWVRLYSGPGQREDTSTAVAVSPDGATVFVTGYASGWGTRFDYATVAYNAATGRQLWASRYTSPGRNDDYARAVAVSPDGATVYVTGWSGWGPAYGTVAYNAANGRQLWAVTYHRHWPDVASSLAVSPDGTAVFVTGQTSAQGGTEYATIAYSAATGKRLWVSYSTTKNDDACCVAVSPEGTTVFVTGASGNSYATIGYRAATGKQIWARRYSGLAGEMATGPSGAMMAVSPDGTTVYVTGYAGHGGIIGYGTVAYSAATGRQLWTSHYRAGPATSVTVSPDGATVYVTGSSGHGPAFSAYATVAYSAATGRQLWARRYGPKAPAIGYVPTSVAVSPDGATVLVTGYSFNDATNLDVITVAYRG